MYKVLHEDIVLHLQKKIEKKKRLCETRIPKKMARASHFGSRGKKGLTSDLLSVWGRPKTPRLLVFRSFAKCTVASDTATAFSRSQVIRILSITTASSVLLFAFCAINFTVMFLQSFSAFNLRFNVSLFALRITLVEVSRGG